MPTATQESAVSEPASTAAAGVAATKFLAPLAGASVALALGFLFLPPKSRAEMFKRMLVTLLCSFLVGPLFVAWAHSVWPAVFERAPIAAALYGLPPVYGIVVLAAPLFVLPGLLGWWVLGWLFHWIDRRREKDIGEVARDIGDGVRDAISGRP
jgi:hypothetical protein